jgi:NADPH:quinone reductase-like Zn-dependent oxidoreductase
VGAERHPGVKIHPGWVVGSDGAGEIEAIGPDVRGFPLATASS